MFKVIIVDDEPQAREYLVNIIPAISPNWEVIGSASNGKDALALFTKNQADLIITDIIMPEMNGLELSKAVKKINPSVLIAFISGYDEFAYVKEAIHIGVSEYLLKPISRKDIQTLLQKIDQKLIEADEYAKQSAMLKQLSNQYRNELIRNLCQAALENNYIRIQTIQPLLYRMHVQQLQKDWCIIAAFAENEITAGFEKWVQDRYLFLQIVRSLIEEKLQYGYVVEANDGSLLLCITGNSEEEANLLADRALSAAEKLCQENLHVPMSSCKSKIKMDILELHEAHREADCLFPLSTLYGTGRYSSNQYDERTNILMESGRSLVEAWSHQDLAHLPGLIQQYCKSISNQNIQHGINNLLHYAHKAFCPHLQTIEKQLLQLTCTNIDDLAFSITEIFSRSMGMERERTTNEKMIDDAILIIRTHLSEPISLGFVADRLKVSANHLSRLFHSVTGESYIRFLTRERMELAAKMLGQSPELKIYDIAERTGYFNVNHFCHVFRDFWGMTPTQYQHTTEANGNFLSR